MPTVKSATKPGKADRKPAIKPPAPLIKGDVVPQGASNIELLKQYEEAVTYMQQGNYAAAHPALEKLLKIAPQQLTDRIRMYLSACVAQATKAPATFTSPEEKFDYAISLLNDGHYEDAREHLDEIIGGKQDADYAFYGLAVLASMTGDSQSCLEKLTEAIRLNVKNRIHARGDSDFQHMADDPRFTELLYPEA
jgi:tetratricopeptide (TPR) repeat protein